MTNNESKATTNEGRVVLLENDNITNKSNISSLQTKQSQIETSLNGHITNYTSNKQATDANISSL